MNDLEELQNTLFTIYKKNLTYLKNNNNILFKKIQEFEKLNIETEYIDFKDGFFEIMNTKTGKGVYNCNSFYDAEQRTDKIAKSKAIFSMLVEKIDSKNYNEENEISAHKFVEKFFKEQLKTIKSEKLIFIGTLLGIHINDIHKKYSHQVYLIIEPSLERFRLSLFFTDYEEISKKSKLFFSIEENSLEVKRTMFEFLEYRFSLNHYIKFELASEKELFLVDELKKLITSANPFITAFSEDIITFQRGFKNILNSNGLLKTNELTLFDEKPILVLGAGPSLEKYQEFIKQFQSKFIIISVSAALKRLEKIDVIPDIIVNIDKKREQILDQFDINEKYYKNSIIFLGPKTNPNILEKLLQKNIFIVQENIELFKNFKTIDCVSAGDFATKLSIELKAKNIYLLGIDAAFDKNKTHDSLHLSSQTLLTDNAYENELFEVDGNFRLKVTTNLHHAQIIESFQKIEFDENTKLYNLSDGAKLYGTTSLKIENIDINLFKNIDKQHLQEDFFNILYKKSIKEFSNLDKKEFQKELKILKRLDNKKDDKDIILLLEKYPNSKSLKIIYKYIKLINPYLTSKTNVEQRNKQLNQILHTLKLIFGI